MAPPIAELKQRLAEVQAVHAAAQVLSWDQTTYMPPGGGPARGRQLSVLHRIAHEKATDPAVGRLLDGLESDLDGLEPVDADLVRVARRDYDRARRVPDEHVARFSAHAAASYEAWSRAREANDFAVAAPFLEKTVELSREYAGFFPDAAHPADPLIDLSDPGVTAARVRALFAELRKGLVPLVREIDRKPGPDTGCLTGQFDTPPQLAFSHEVAERLGYDFTRGRLDLTLHPFCVGFSISDVRITTRVREDDWTECLFSTIHEAGHGLYEQGLDRALEGTPLGHAASSGLHESQSRLWENLVGRSRPFWEHLLPRLRRTFPEVPDNVEGVYRAVNEVCPSLIRTDADEVTYNLHVMMRFDFELDLLEGRLAVRDLPEAWEARIHDDLGVRPADDNSGVLQDVHWFCDHAGGAFQGYTLGNLYAAQLFAAACRDHPGIPQDMATGRFGTLREWLREHVHRHGRRRTAAEIVEAATGAAPGVGPFLDYLNGKYGALYGLGGVGAAEGRA